MIMGKACPWCQLELADLEDIRTIPTTDNLVHKEGRYQAAYLWFIPTPEEPYIYDCIGHPAIPCTMICPWVAGNGPYVLNVKCKKGHYEPPTHTPRGPEGRDRSDTTDPRTPETDPGPGAGEADDDDHEDKPEDPEDDDQEDEGQD